VNSKRNHLSVLANFIAGAVAAGIALTVLLLIQGLPASQILGLTPPPTERTGWWGLVALSAALGAAAGTAGILVGWLLSRPRAPLRRRADAGQ
jgi:hypothetical protein